MFNSHLLTLFFATFFNHKNQQSLFYSYTYTQIQTQKRHFDKKNKSKNISGRSTFEMHVKSRTMNIVCFIKVSPKDCG